MSLADLLRSHKKPVVVQFHAPWCGPCKSLSPHVQAMETEFQGQIDVVRIDVDNDSDLAQEAKVRGVPTLVAYRDGAEIRRHSGALPKDALRTFFQSVAGIVPLQTAVQKPNWQLAAKFVVALALFLASGQFPGLDWLKWVGMGVLFWAMREICPACRVASNR